MDGVIHGFVAGTPKVKKQVTGDTESPARWKRAVIDQTKGSGQLSGPCQLEIEFVLPPASFNEGHPYGPDLDNLAKSMLDALADTVLRDPGKDGAIVDLRVRKRKVQGEEASGARFILALRGDWAGAK